MIACSSEKKENQAFKKMKFSIYPPALPPDQMCITEIFEIEGNTLKYTKSEGLCGGTTPKDKSQTVTLTQEKRQEIRSILVKLKADKFSKDSKYDGNASANLNIQWGDKEESFSFLHYEGEEITKLHTTLRAMIKEAK
ncbi:hypothetical protein AD998_14525 [bacterium 336/3]|nr:hypothetical protein AD998_14525 [bacterium 336/3]